MSNRRHHQDDKGHEHVEREVNQLTTLFYEAEVNRALLQFPLLRLAVLFAPNHVTLHVHVCHQLIVQILLLCLLKLILYSLLVIMMVVVVMVTVVMIVLILAIMILLVVLRKFELFLSQLNLFRVVPASFVSDCRQIVFVKL